MKPDTTGRTLAKFHYLYDKPFGNDHIRSLHHFFFHDRRQEYLIEGNTEYEKVPYHLTNKKLKKTDIFQIIIMLMNKHTKSPYAIHSPIFSAR